MAVATQTNYFTNAIVGQMMAGANTNVHQVDAEPKFPLGQGFIRGDGAKFRYGHFGVATSAGNIVSQDISETTIADKDNSVIAPASARTVAGETMKPGAIGSHYVDMSIAGVVSNQLAGSYFIVTDGTGIGYTYRVKGNLDADSSNNVLISLFDPIKVALDATSDVSITGSLYSNLEAATSQTDTAAAGVACAHTTATSPYGWVQTAGVCGVLMAAAGTVGQQVTLSTTAGQGTIAGNAATAANNILQPIIGTIVDVGDASGLTAVNLRLE